MTQNVVAVTQAVNPRVVNRPLKGLANSRAIRFNEKFAPQLVPAANPNAATKDFHPKIVAEESNYDWDLESLVATNLKIAARRTKKAVARNPATAVKKPPIAAQQVKVATKLETIVVEKESGLTFAFSNDLDVVTTANPAVLQNPQSAAKVIRVENRIAAIADKNAAMQIPAKLQS